MAASMLTLEEVLDRAGEPWPTRPRDKIVCPFHEDTTPSMHLYTTDPEHAYCFTCGEWADPYRLLEALTGEKLERPWDGRTSASRGVGAKGVAMAPERRLRRLSGAFFPKLDDLTYQLPWAEYLRGWWADRFHEVTLAILDEECTPAEAERMVGTLQALAQRGLDDASHMLVIHQDGVVGSEVAPQDEHARRPRRERVRHRSPFR